LRIGDVYGNSRLKEPGEPLQEKHGENRQKAQKWLVFERLFKHNETYHVFQNKTNYSLKSHLSLKKKN
jgi:hypothetical protein